MKRVFQGKRFDSGKSVHLWAQNSDEQSSLNLVGYHAETKESSKLNQHSRGNAVAHR